MYIFFAGIADRYMYTIAHHNFVCAVFYNKAYIYYIGFM